MTIERIHPQNDERAAWAAKALAAFQKEAGADLPELVGDLLVDLMHWCDRNTTTSTPHCSAPATITRRKSKARNSVEPPLAARVGLSGAGFFYHVKEVRRVSPSIAPGRAPRRAQENNFPLRVWTAALRLPSRPRAARDPCGAPRKILSCPPRRPSMLCTHETPTKEKLWA